MAKNNIKWNSDKVVSLSAMSISLITLVIFIYQTNLMSKQNYLSILPYLSISTSNSSGDNTFKVSLENYGVGPAIIESVTLKYNGKNYNLGDYDNDLFSFLKTKAPELDSIKNISYSTLDKGMAIPINSTYRLVEVNNSPKDYLLLRDGITKLLEEGLYYEIIYRSIQDERWLISNHTKGPKKLR